MSVIGIVLFLALIYAFGSMILEVVIMPVLRWIYEKLKTS